MDPRALMGMLEAKSPNLRGSGGIPEITPEIVAGALGSISDAFVRETFCALYWPGGAAITRKQYQAAMGKRLCYQHWQTIRAHIEAQADLGIAQAMGTDEFTLRRLRAREEACRDQRWPAWTTTYLRVPDAVVSEVGLRNLCETCGGSGSHHDGLKVVSCPACEGLGVVPVSNRQRARMLEIDEARYRASWHRPYEWALDLIRAAEQSALSEMTRQLAA